MVSGGVDGQRRQRRGFVEAEALLQLVEDLVGADDRVLEVRPGLADEAHRLVDVERDHRRARDT